MDRSQKTYIADRGKLIIRRSAHGQLYWRVVGNNGEKISGSTESHTTMEAVRESIKLTHSVLHETNEQRSKER